MTKKPQNPFCLPLIANLGILVSLLTEGDLSGIKFLISFQEILRFARKILCLEDGNRRMNVFVTDH